MIKKEQISEDIGNFLRFLPVKMAHNERIVGMMVVVRTNRKIKMLQETSFFTEKNFELDVLELAQRIYDEKLDFALSGREVYFGQAIVRLPKSYLKEMAPRLQVSEKVKSLLSRYNIKYLIDALCFDLKDIKTILNVDGAEEVRKHVEGHQLKMASLKSPDTIVHPSGHHNRQMEIICQYLVA